MDKIWWERGIRTMYQANQSKHMQVTRRRRKIRRTRTSRKNTQREREREREVEKEKEKASHTVAHLSFRGKQKRQERIKQRTSTKRNKNKAAATVCIRWCGSEQRKASEWRKGKEAKPKEQTYIWVVKHKKPISPSHALLQQLGLKVSFSLLSLLLLLLLLPLHLLLRLYPLLDATKCSRKEVKQLRNRNKHTRSARRKSRVKKQRPPAQKEPEARILWSKVHQETSKKQNLPQ